MTSTISEIEKNFDKKAKELGLLDCIERKSCDACDSYDGYGGGITSSNKVCDKCDYAYKLQEFVSYQPLQFYPEPDFRIGIPLSSDEGKGMFKQAVCSPYMECYYKLSPQIENQTEYTCSTTSLMVALNTLGIDPAMASWYDEWRWHHLGSLACCTAILQHASKTLHQFSCLAVCNDTLAFPVTVEDDWTLEHLRAWIQLVTSRSDVVMIANYGRVALNQNGSGHFLPICGYHEERDRVLLIDIAKHKYPPHWVSLNLLMGAMKAPDNRHGGNRGFTLLTRPDYDPSIRLFGPSLLLRLDDLPGRVDARLDSFMANWNRWLDSTIPITSTCDEILNSTIEEFLSSIPQHHQDDNDEPTTPPSTPSTSTPTTKFSLLDMTLVHFHGIHPNNDGIPSIVARCPRPHRPDSCPNTSFCRQLQSLDVFGKVKTCLESMTDQDRGRIVELVVGHLDGIDQAVNYTKSKCLAPRKMESIAKSLKSEKMTNHKASHASQCSKGLCENGDNMYPEKDDSICPGFVEFLPQHILTFCLLSWPLKKIKSDTILAFRKYMFRDAKFDAKVNPKAMNNADVFSILLRTFEGDHSENDNTRKRLAVGGSRELPEGTHSKCAKIIDDIRGNTKEQSGICQRNATAPQSFENTTTVRSYLHSLFSQQLSKSDCNVVKDQIRALKRKFVVALDYHQLL